MVSTVFGSATTKCFQFYYHMFGKNIGTLNIYQKGFKSNSKPALLWTRSGDLGNVWKYGSIELYKNFTEPTYTILVEGIVGNGN